MNVLGKMICPDCNGNGYLGSANNPDNCRDCKKCNNQGEIEITKESIQELLNEVESARLQ